MHSFVQPSKTKVSQADYTMKQVIHGERAVIQLRGTVPADHSLAFCCYDKPPRAAFKLLLALADEAIHTRDGLKRLLTDDHPLSQNLRDMSPQEALAFLLGMTKASPGTLSLSMTNSDPNTRQESDKSTDTPPPIRRARLNQQAVPGKESVNCLISMLRTCWHLVLRRR